jgi:hypothetical protein
MALAASYRALRWISCLEPVARGPTLPQMNHRHSCVWPGWPSGRGVLERRPLVWARGAGELRSRTLHGFANVRQNANCSPWKRASPLFVACFAFAVKPPPVPPTSSRRISVEIGANARGNFHTFSNDLKCSNLFGGEYRCWVFARSGPPPSPPASASTTEVTSPP